MQTKVEMVALMYSQSWVQFTLSGEVRQRADTGPDRAVVSKGRFYAAPGRRYRAELTDEYGDRVLDVCDGKSHWIISDGTAVAGDAKEAMPFNELLNPSWILADFDVEITGQTECLGRMALSVAGSRREASRGRKSLHRPGERVRGLIDNERRAGQPVVTSDPGDLRALDPAIRLISI